MLQHLPDEGIKVFASMLHAHLLGVEIQVYHFRNGVQLTNSNLGSDTSYDFNYQEYRTLKNQITIMKVRQEWNENEGVLDAPEQLNEKLCCAILRFTEMSWKFYVGTPFLKRT